MEQRPEHPDLSRVGLTDVMGALSDPIRIGLVRVLGAAASDDVGGHVGLSPTG